MPSKQPRNNSKQPRNKVISSSSWSQSSRTKAGRTDLHSNSKQKPLKPLLSVSRPPALDLSHKGKARAKPKPEIISFLDDFDEAAPHAISLTEDRFWVDAYEPHSEAELAVHKRKVEDVRRWFQEAFEGGPTGKLKKYRRILVLTGLAGTAKTTTVRVLSRELGFDISEWRSSLEENYLGDDNEREGLNQKFGTFLARAGTCRPLLSGRSQLSSSSSSSQTGFPASSSSVTLSSQERKQIVLLEDLPNILHQPTQAAFHDALESFVATPQDIPLVIIISDTSTRGEVRDERLAQGGFGYWSLRDSVDIRSVLPPSLINGPYVTQITFNPIAPTLMLRALQEMLSRHYTNLDIPQSRCPTKEDLNIIVETSNGDIRSAVMALQFSCVLENSKGKSVKGKKKSARTLMEAISRREQALALFHLMGKVLYNKRKGDPPSASVSAKDKLREQELDARLKDSLPLAPWFGDHKRRASRVDVDSLYADSPIDTSLFALYIHQNYTQFCDDVDQCGELSDWLSWIDSSGGEHWYQTNPHQFHLLTLGTLHSLPSPVARRGQKMYKPEFFDVLKKTREAEDALGDVWTWLHTSGSVRWSREEIALEMGSLLKTRTRSISAGSLQDADTPPAHSAFSTLAFSKSSTSKAETLDADGTDERDFEMPMEDEIPQHVNGKKPKDENEGESWLPDDDIDDF